MSTPMVSFVPMGATEPTCISRTQYAVVPMKTLVLSVFVKTKFDGQSPLGVWIMTPGRIFASATSAQPGEGGASFAPAVMTPWRSVSPLEGATEAQPAKEPARSIRARIGAARMPLPPRGADHRLWCAPCPIEKEG